MNLLKIVLFVIFTSVGLMPVNSYAQNDPFVEMQRRMAEMQRRMMQSLQNNPFWGEMPGAQGRDSSDFFFRFDTSFSFKGGRPFRIDTTLSDGSTLRLFFGGDSTAQQFFRGFGHFFGDMMDMEQDFGWQEGEKASPKDDGNHPPDDGLLPEERIRRKEQKQPEPSDPGNKPAKPAKPENAKKSTIKTTRI